FFDPVCTEDGFKIQHAGDMQGFASAFVAALTAEVDAGGLDGVTKGIYAGLQKARDLFIAGFGRSDKKPGYPIDKVFKKRDDHPMSFSEVLIPPIVEKAYGNYNHWMILEERIRNKGKLEDTAFSLARHSDEKLLKNVPSARFGGIFTMDRYEIESLQSIKNLMLEYLHKDTNKPLSIAVFGPPGCGKTYYVTELAKSIDKDRVEKKEFNISQFTSADDLIDAFHEVRDMVLAGKVPLVFFDEFDSSYDGEPLGWLKYFLLPMEDGEFKEGEALHPIGKAIFVFAGATSHDFRHFSRENPEDFSGEREWKDVQAEFRRVKGVDFVSRLRGYINIMGPNKAGNDDSLFMIRRALVLRSFLDRKARQVFDEDGTLQISPGLLRAFIKVPKYKHGGRSMEAIIDMSTLAGRFSYEEAALPSVKQLDLHVDSDVFYKLMVRDVLFNDAMERLAATAHDYSVKDLAGRKNRNDPSMQPWDRLRADFKESSRKRSWEIPDKLRKIGLDFIPYVEKPKTQFKFTDEQVETLAMMEHERWMKERTADGWKPGIRSDPDKKISPYLVPWSDLPEEIKDRDRNPVRRIPQLLEEAGFEIYSVQ
ncbi:MAG TPA: RyR domain-containing protein, partial [Methanocella sp.]|nr:RyR domain-containing protein [Methanocella sp.]